VVQWDCCLFLSFPPSGTIPRNRVLIEVYSVNEIWREPKTAQEGRNEPVQYSSRVQYNESERVRYRRPNLGKGREEQGNVPSHSHARPEV
jgi:hypothetical protein